MKGYELLIKHPLTAKLVKEWFLEQMINSFDKSNAPDDFKEHMKQQAVSTDNVANIIDNNARALFDLFDENGIYIHILIECGEDVLDTSFSYEILPRDLDFDNWDWYSSRKEAEQVAIIDAFNLLEEQLSL